MSKGPVLSEFDYHLPEELIAQRPLDGRDESRVLVLDRSAGEIKHRQFFDVPGYLGPGDCLVLNDTRVFPARLLGAKEGTGGRVEFLLVEAITGGTWLVLSRPAKGLKPGAVVVFPKDLRARVLEVRPEGERIVEFEDARDVLGIAKEVGKVPLPPYIRGQIDDSERYQTVYGNKEGSCAAPTAGLHFTGDLLDRVRETGCQTVTVTLHVGPGTFMPVRSEDVSEHRMPVERYWLPPEAADTINASKRVIAVGTTCVRTLETSACEDGLVVPGSGRTGLFIYPGYRYKVVDAMITNFHLPKSTLLMLVSAFAGTERILHVYREAVKSHYRFFSFGDAMLIL